MSGYAYMTLKKSSLRPNRFGKKDRKLKSKKKMRYEAKKRIREELATIYTLLEMGLTNQD